MSAPYEKDEAGSLVVTMVVEIFEWYRDRGAGTGILTHAAGRI